MLTQEQIALVQENWKAVVPIKEVAAEIFYGRLFELDPTLKELFPDDMAEQGKKLMQTLGVAVGSLRDLEGLVPVVQDLGRRHVDYKVTSEMYSTVGQALLDTLEKGLGDAFTPEAKEAWTEVYVTLSTVMIEAADGYQPEEVSVA
ncbi:MAG: globin family protein [Planctomycetota bacterium]